MPVKESLEQTTACAGRSAPRPPDATGATLHDREPTMTNELTRRQLLSAGAAASVAALPSPGILAGAAAPAEMPRRKFYAILSLGRLGFRSEEHTSELQSQSNLVCRLLLEKKKNKKYSETRR